jgi:membrane-associated phospholipid phosphatase
VTGAAGCGAGSPIGGRRPFWVGRPHALLPALLGGGCGGALMALAVGRAWGWTLGAAGLTLAVGAGLWHGRDGGTAGIVTAGTVTCGRVIDGRTARRVAAGTAAGLAGYGGLAAGQLSTATGLAFVVMGAAAFALAFGVSGRGSVLRFIGSMAIAEWCRQLLLSGRHPVGLLALGQVQGPLAATARLGGGVLVAGLVAGCAAIIATAVVPTVLRRRWTEAGICLAAFGGLVVVSSVLPSHSGLIAAPASALPPVSARLERPPPSFGEAVVANAVDLAVLTGERRNLAGLAIVRTGHRPVAVVNAGGDLPTPWARAATDLGVNTLVLLPGNGGRDDGAGAGPATRVAAARVQAVAIGRPIVLVWSGRPPTVIGPDGGLRPLAELAALGPRPAGRGAALGPAVPAATLSRPASATAPYRTGGDLPVLLAAVLITAAGSRNLGRDTIEHVASTAGWAALSLAVVTVLGCFAGELVTAGATGRLVGHVDKAVRNAVLDHQHDLLSTASNRASILGRAPVVVVVACVVGLVAQRRKRSWLPLAFLLGASLGAELMTAGIKLIVRRPGPSGGAVRGILGSSFPSGHAAAAAATTTALAVLIIMTWRSNGVRWVTLLSVTGIVASVALSRVYLNAHWLTDVCAGTVFGAIWSLTLAQVLRWKGLTSLSSRSDASAGRIA